MFNMFNGRDISLISKCGSVDTVSLQSINQSIVRFITRYIQLLSVSPIMNRERGWYSGVSRSAGGRDAS